MTCNDAEILCIKGEALTVQGNPKAAVLYFEAFINMHQINERAILSHDIALFLNNHEAHNNAIYIIEKALEHSPKQIDLLQEYAYSLEQNGETERAIEIFNQLLDIDPYKTGAWFLLGSLYYNNNEYSDALDCYEFSLAINPEDTISWLQKAHCLFYLDQFEAAILAYKKYLHEFPKDSNAILFLAECYENREEYETALSFYELAFKLDSENIDASLGSAICCFECKRYNEAKIYIDIANNIFPNNAEILAYKGDIYSQLAFSENNNSLILEGLTAYKASIALDDDQPRICIAIANIFCHFNNYRAAIKYYEMAFEKDSKIHQLPILIAMSYFQIQDYESMKHYLDIGQLENSNIVNDFLEL